jgi:hypothetical protein
MSRSLFWCRIVISLLIESLLDVDEGRAGKDAAIAQENVILYIEHNV